MNGPDGPVNFFKVGNIINQRHFRSELSRATFKLELTGMADGQEAGMAHFNGGSAYASLGVCQKRELKLLKYEENGQTTTGPELPKAAAMIWMLGLATNPTMNPEAHNQRYSPRIALACG